MTYQNHQPNQKLPQQKRELTKAWGLTIFLHLIIASAIIGYWYFGKKAPTSLPRPISPPAMAMPNNPSAKLPPVMTETASTPQANVASTPTAINLASTTLPSERPLASYINKQLAQQPNLSQPSQIEQRLHIDIAPPPINHALTSRDIPSVERKINPNMSKEQQEIASLADELDKDHDKISELIQKTKQQNQQKIDEQLRQNSENISDTPKLAQTTEQNTEKANEKLTDNNTISPNTTNQDSLQDIDIPSKAE